MESQEEARLKKTQLHASYGLKKGLKRRNWKRRFFVLTTDSIGYYNLRGERMGNIPLANVRNVTSCKENPLELLIETPDRTFRVVLDSEEDMEQWLRWLPCTGAGSLLFERIQAGDNEAVGRLLHCGVSPLEPLQESGFSPLLAAAMLPGSVETSSRVLGVLLEHEEMGLTQLRETTVDGRNALHLACEAGNPENLQLLHAHISAIDPAVAATVLAERDARGRCLLHLAAESGSVQLARWLLVHMTPEAVHYRSGADQSPLHVAASRGHLELCRLLLSSGADLEDRDCHFDSPMDMAVCGSHMDLADWLRAQAAAVQVCTPWLHSILIPAGQYPKITAMLANQRKKPVPWKVILDQLTAPTSPSSTVAAPPPLRPSKPAAEECAKPMPDDDLDDADDESAEVDGSSKEEEAEEEDAAGEEEEEEEEEEELVLPQQEDPASPSSCFYRMALIVNVLIGWSREDLVTINRRGSAHEPDMDASYEVLHRLAAAQRLIGLCEKILPSIDCPPSSVDVDVHIRQHEWTREGQNAREFVIASQAKTEAYYMMSNAVIRVIRRYSPRYSYSSFEEKGAEEDIRSSAPPQRISDLHFETMLRSIHSITTSNCTLVRDAHKRLDQRREEISAALKNCHYLNKQDRELEGLHDLTTVALAGAEDGNSLRGILGVSFETFDLGQLWNERLTSTITVVLSAFAAAVLNHMNSAAPCGFSLCLRGPLARKHAFPYSQLEMVILATDNNHMEWFRIYANLFHMKLLQLGETEHIFGGLGSVCPAGLSLAPLETKAKLDGLITDTVLIGTPKRVAELQRQEQYEMCPELAQSLLAVQFFYGSDPDLVKEYDELLARFSASRTGGAASPLPCLRQLHSADGLRRELEWGALSLERKLGLLSVEARSRPLVDLTGLWNFVSNCIAAFASLAEIEPCHSVALVSQLYDKKMLCSIAATELMATLNHLSALCTAYQLFFQSRSVQFWAPIAPQPTPSNRSFFKIPCSPLETAQMWLGVLPSKTPTSCQLPVLCHNIVQRCIASSLKLYDSVAVELNRSTALLASDVEVSFSDKFPTALVAQAREWMGLSEEASRLLCKVSLEDEKGPDAVTSRLALARLRLCAMDSIEALSLAQAAASAPQLTACFARLRVEAHATKAVCLDMAARWAEGLCSVESALEECASLMPGASTSLHVLLARFFSEDRLYKKALQQLEQAMTFAAKATAGHAEASAMLLLAQALLSEDQLERSEEASLAAQQIASRKLPWTHPFIFQCLVVRATALAMRRDYAEAAALLEMAWYRTGRWCGTRELPFALLLLDVASACSTAGGLDVRLHEMHKAATSTSLSILRGVALPGPWELVLLRALVLEANQLSHGLKPDHTRALEVMEEAAAVLKGVALKPSHPLSASVSTALGQALAAVGHHKRAMKVLEAVLTSCKQAYGSESGACASALHALGLAWHSAGNDENAIQYHRLALKIRRKLYGATSRPTLLSVDSLAVAMHSSGQHEAAVELFQKFLTSATELSSEPSEGRAALHYKLGSAYSRAGDAKNAAAQLRLCLSMREELYGPVHRLVAVPVIKLASILADVGDFPAAAELYDRALLVQRKLYGKSHLKVAAILDRLGEVCWDWQKVDACRQFSEMALEMRQALLPAGHPVVAVSMYKLALICDEAGELERARALYDESMEVWKSNFGDKHPIHEQGMAGLKKLNRGRRYRSLRVNTGL